MRDVPEWAVSCLGGLVGFTRQVELGERIYQRGDSAVFVSIQSGWPDSAQPYATIALDPEDPGWEENVPFDAIEPKRQ